MTARSTRIESFDFQPGRVIGGKYVIESLLGSGWEGEVYKVVERRMGIPRAAKIFYPQRNARDRAAKLYARKLDRLRNCPIIIQYHHSETIRHRGLALTCLISELVEGELLSTFIARQRGKRVSPFEALHVLYALACGLEQIHAAREYHGDIHDDNVLVRRRGIRFDVKLVDFYDWGRPDATKIREDIFQLIRLFYDTVGGRARYAQQPAEIKAICCGLRRDLITRKFRSTGRLREYLESFAWRGS